MKTPWILLLLTLIMLTVFLLDDDVLFVFNNTDNDGLPAGLSMVIDLNKEADGFLESYPFPLLDPPVTIAEGFLSYDGKLGDEEDFRHWAIDYVHEDNGVYKKFPVYAAHGGTAFQGESDSFGLYVLVKNREISGKWYNTLYAHLENIPDYIPFKRKGVDDTGYGFQIPSQTYLGQAGHTGNTKGIAQLHFELHIFDQGTPMRTDPYGIFEKFSSGLYPQPGDSLGGTNNYWIDDFPKFPQSWIPAIRAGV